MGGIKKYARIVQVLQSLILAINFDESFGLRHKGIFEDINSVRHTFVEPSKLQDFNGHGTAMEEDKAMV